MGHFEPPGESCPLVGTVTSKAVVPESRMTDAQGATKSISGSLWMIDTPSRQQVVIQLAVDA